MELAGLLISRTDVDAGRRRRHYLATDHGVAVLAECRTALAELAHELLSQGPATVDDRARLGGPPRAGTSGLSSADGP